MASDFPYLEKAIETAEFIKNQQGKQEYQYKNIEAVIAAGSAGIGGIEKEIKQLGYLEINFENLPNWKSKTISGQEGKLLIGDYKGARVALLMGRLHQYQGYDYHDISFPYLVLRELADTSNGKKPVLISTHAVGGINPEHDKDYFKPGDILITESSYFLHDPNIPFREQPADYGPEFISCTNLYEPVLRMFAHLAASRIKDRGFDVKTNGISIVLPGPKFETTAEIEDLRQRLPLEPKVVGMSGNELLMAHHMGYYVLDLAAITNMAIGLKEMREYEEKYLMIEEMKAMMENKVPFHEARKRLGGEIFDKLGPTHEEVKAMQEIAGRNLELVIGELINSVDFTH